MHIHYLLFIKALLNCSMSIRECDVNAMHVIFHYEQFNVQSDEKANDSHQEHRHNVTTTKSNVYRFYWESLSGYIGFTGGHCSDTVELSVIGVEERIDGEDTQYSEAQRYNTTQYSEALRIQHHSIFRSTTNIAPTTVTLCCIFIFIHTFFL